MTIDEFSRAVTALRPTLYRICRAQLRNPADREDAVQEAICRAWQKRRALRDPKAFDGWLIRILVNECHNLQRRGSRLVLTDAPPEPPATAENGRAAELLEAMDAMDEKLRLCVLLHYIEGYSVKEVARMLCIGESAAKQRLRRGRAKLREMLSEEVFGR